MTRPAAASGMAKREPGLPPPPMVRGARILGNVRDYLRDPVALLRAGHERYGRVFGIRLGHRRAAVLLGGENTRFFFHETDRALSLQEQHRWLRPMLGRRFPLVASAGDYRNYRAVYAAPFHPGRTDAYLDRMAAEVAEWLDGLGREGEMEIVRETGVLTLRAAARAILGEELRERLGADLWRLFSRLVRPSEFHLTRNLQLPCPRRARARRKLRAAVAEVVGRRRALAPGNADFLDAFLAARTAEGERVADEDIVDLAIGNVWAAYPTSSAHLAWAVVLLLQNPSSLSAVVEEVREETPEPGAIDSSSLARLTRLERVLLECERLRPAVLVIGRETSRPYEREGFGIPGSWLTLVSPAVTHRMSEEFPDPDRFDPERYDPATPGGRRAAASLVGFGGGVHACLGKQFAYAWLKIALAGLVGRYELELLTHDPRPATSPNPNRPRAPVRVAYRRR